MVDSIDQNFVCI